MWRCFVETWTFQFSSIPTVSPTVGQKVRNPDVIDLPPIHTKRFITSFLMRMKGMEYAAANICVSWELQF